MLPGIALAQSPLLCSRSLDGARQSGKRLGMIPGLETNADRDCCAEWHCRDFNFLLALFFPVLEFLLRCLKGFSKSASEHLEKGYPLDDPLPEAFFHPPGLHTLEALDLCLNVGKRLL